MVWAGGEPYRRAMAQRRKRSASRRDADSRSVPLQLPPDRAFVLHLDADALPPRRMLGRVEHVVSGRVAHVTSLRGLVAFLADVLRDGAPGDLARLHVEGSGRRSER